MRIVARALIIALMIAGCNKQESTQSATSFYYWKQTYNISTDSKMKPSHIKVIDIGVSDNGEIGIINTQFKTKINATITPIVYIDNGAMNKLDTNSTINTISNQINQMSKSANYDYNTIGVDCDWSDSSRAKFFDFIARLKKISGKKIEVTLRLHQIKYANKTGVPPADKAVLMYYNMSDFENTETKNYIIDNEVGARYMSGFRDYPLGLDLALPLYSQATIIRFGRVVGLITPIDDTTINTNWQKIDNNRYSITKTHYFNGRLLYKNDEIRIDKADIDELEDAITMLKKVMKKPKNIIFYEWGDKDKYDMDRLHQLWL